MVFVPVQKLHGIVSIEPYSVQGLFQMFAIHIFKCLTELHYHLILKQTNLRRRPHPSPLMAWFAG